LVYDYGPIALRLSLPDVRGCDATAAAIAKAMREVGMERATLVGHSFGTVVASWVLRHCPEHIHSTVLIDPVSLQLARADVAFAAIHRKPVSAADVLLEYFVFREQSKQMRSACTHTCLNKVGHTHMCEQRRVHV